MKKHIQRLATAQAGHGHILIVAALVVGLVGLVGFRVVSSNKDSLQNATTAGLKTGPCSGGDGLNTNTHYCTRYTDDGPKTYAPYTNPNLPSTDMCKNGCDWNKTRAYIQKAYAKERAAANEKLVSDSNNAEPAPAADNPTTSVETNPPYVSPSTSQAAAALSQSSGGKVTAQPTPQVNVLVYTFVKDKNGNKKRLGGVQMKVVRDDVGKKTCNKHRKQVATTSKSTDEKKKGSLRYISCEPGDYTVTVVGRKGYTLVSDKEKKVSLKEDNKTAKFRFVFTKDEVKTKKKTESKTPVQTAPAPSTSTTTPTTAPVTTTP